MEEDLTGGNPFWDINQGGNIYLSRVPLSCPQVANVSFEPNINTFCINDSSVQTMMTANKLTMGHFIINTGISKCIELPTLFRSLDLITSTGL